MSILVVSGANLLTSEEQSLGAITTILGTDRLTDSRTTINDNFTDLDTTKMEMATSSIDSITTLSNLTAVGALSSGSLTTGFTAIPVSLGGTGTTTPETYRVMLGDGSNGLTMASTSGTNGQFLTSSGDGSYPTWSTSAIDEGANYSWSGIHSFASTGTFAVTGVGFEPEFIYVMAGEHESLAFSWGFGTAGGASKLCATHWRKADDSRMSGVTTEIAYYWPNGSHRQLIDIDSMDSDGATFGNLKVGSPTGTFSLYMYFMRFSA